MSTGSAGAGSKGEMTSGNQQTQGVGSSATSSTGNSSTTGTGKKVDTTHLTQSLMFDTNAYNSLTTSLNDTTYRKDKAIADAQEASKNAMTQILQGALPGIESNVKTAGSYNSTVDKLMTDDLMAKTAAAGSSVVLDTIKNYAQISQGNINASVNAVNATTGKSTDGTTSSDTSGTTNTSNTGTSVTNNSNQTNMQSQSNDMALTTAGSAGSVICTQLYNDGHVPKFIYDADMHYVDMHFTQATINGYRFWAVPFVYGMRRWSWLYAVGKYFGTRWCSHCAAHYIQSPQAQKSKVIKVTMWLGVPICWAVGSIIPEVKYYKLWAGS